MLAKATPISLKPTLNMAVACNSQPKAEVLQIWLTVQTAANHLLICCVRT